MGGDGGQKAFYSSALVLGLRLEAGTQLNNNEKNYSNFL